MSRFPEEIYKDAYPARILCFSLGHMTLSYALGFVIMLRIHPLSGALFLALCAGSLVACLRYRCRFCFYFGKACYVGLGKLAAVLYQPGEPRDFARAQNLVPAAVFSFTVLLLPMATIVALAILRFSWVNVVLLACYLLLVVFAGFAVRKSHYCDHCRQAELGCPAYDGMRGKQR